MSKLPKFTVSVLWPLSEGHVHNFRKLLQVSHFSSIYVQIFQILLNLLCIGKTDTQNKRMQQS